MDQINHYGRQYCQDAESISGQIEYSINPYYLIKSVVFQAEVNVRKSIFVEFVIFSFISIYMFPFL